MKFKEIKGRFCILGDFVVGGEPEKCDETKSLYCVAKMTVLEEDILEAHFFCDQTITDSSCGSDTLASCTEPTNYTKVVVVGGGFLLSRLKNVWGMIKKSSKKSLIYHQFLKILKRFYQKLFH